MASLPSTIFQKQPTLRLAKKSLSCAIRHRRAYSSTSLPNVSIANGQSEKEILQELGPLLQEMGGRWSVVPNGKGIHADFHFKTFKKAWVSFSYLLS